MSFREGREIRESREFREFKEFREIRKFRENIKLPKLLNLPKLFKSDLSVYAARLKCLADGDEVLSLECRTTDKTAVYILLREYLTSVRGLARATV